MNFKRLRPISLAAIFAFARVGQLDCAELPAGQTLLAEVVTLRLSDVGLIHRDTLNIPSHLLAEDFSTTATDKSPIKRMWGEAEVWRTKYQIEIPEAIKLLQEKEKTAEWYERGDDIINNKRRTLNLPDVIIILKGIEVSNIERYYLFWLDEKLVWGGFCRVAADGYYQESPQAKCWSSRMPDVVDLVAKKIIKQGN